MRERSPTVISILVSGPTVPASLETYCAARSIRIDHRPDDLDAVELLRLADSVDYYYLGGNEYLAEEFLGAATRLKAISLVGTGESTFIDVKSAADRNIGVLTTPGVNAKCVAEFCVGLALNICRGMCDAPVLSSAPRRRELSEASAGILGMGAVGTALATMLTDGFGCRVGYASRTRKNDVENSLNIRHEPSVQSLFEHSDLLFVCCSLNDSTRSLIDAQLLGSGSLEKIVVSIADPDVFAPDAVSDALAGGLIGGLAMDCDTDQIKEIIPSESTNSPILVTEHIAAATPSSWGRMMEAASDNLTSYMDEAVAK
jgi:glyoxylate reductase